MATELSPGWFHCPGPCNSNMGACGFGKSKQNAHGLQHYCKVCSYSAKRKRRAAAKPTVRNTARAASYLTRYDK